MDITDPRYITQLQIDSLDHQIAVNALIPQLYLITTAAQITLDHAPIPGPAINQGLGSLTEELQTGIK